MRIDGQQAVHTFAPIFPKVPKKMSYGYEFEDGSVMIERLQFFDTPSPGKPNADSPAEPDPPESHP